MKKSLITGNNYLYNTICGLCGDYDRRERAIAEGTEHIYTLLEYRRLNEAIDRAISSVCEEDICHIMRKEIANHIGCRYTKIPYRSNSSVKRLKQRSMLAIARELHLIGGKE